MSCATAEDKDMQAIIERRIKAIKDANSNSVIEGIDPGLDELEQMLQRAREPISNEEFTRRELALWHKKWSKVKIRSNSAALPQKHILKDERKQK